ncbi:MAG: PRC-barrel domain-containing protein [Methanobacterium sp.]
MRIVDELKGKEVIDDKGDKVGNVSDVEWNPETNKVASLIVTEGVGPSTKIGRGQKRIVSYEKIQSLGEKVLLKGQ